VRDFLEEVGRLLRALVLVGVLLAAAYFFLTGIQSPYLMTDRDMADAIRALLASIALLIWVRLF
jgi:hypothetical protein